MLWQTLQQHGWQGWESLAPFFPKIINSNYVFAAWVDDSVFQTKTADDEWLMSDPSGRAGPAGKRSLTLGRKTKQSSASAAAKAAAVAAATKSQRSQSSKVSCSFLLSPFSFRSCFHIVRKNNPVSATW
jgi:hypothetical protein